MRLFRFAIAAIIASLPLKAISEEWPQAKVVQSRHRMNTLISRSAERIASKYGVACIGSGAAMFGGPINEMRISFQIKGPLSKSEMRKLLLAFVTDVQEVARAIKDLNEYVAEPPFGVKNICVKLFQTDQNGHPVFYPLYGVATSTDGRLNYYASDPERIKYPYLHEEEETYEEAFEAVRKENEQANSAPQ